MSETPQLRRGLAVLGSLVAMFATAPGQTFVISNFNGALTEGLGLTPSRLAAAYLVGTLLSAASLPTAGRVADRIGPRRMIGLASIGIAAAGLALSQAQGLVTLTLAFFLLRFFGQGVISLASSHALALRFDGRLGSVEGLRGATISGAIALTPQITVGLIAAHGWRDAAWMLGAGAGTLGLFASVVLLDKDPDPRNEPVRVGGVRAIERGHTLAEARRTGALWILLGSGALVATLLTAVHFHLQPILRELDPGGSLAAATFVSFAATGLVATLLGGLLVDRFPPRFLLAAALALLGAGTFVVGRGDAVAAHAGMGLLGFGHGIATSAIPPTLARYFGRAHHGAIRGLAGTCAVAGSAAGPYLFGLAAERLGGFDTALHLLALTTVPLVISALWLRGPVPPPSAPAASSSSAGTGRRDGSSGPGSNSGSGE